MYAVSLFDGGRFASFDAVSSFGAADAFENGSIALIFLYRETRPCDVK
jgi:hypothetical protein